MASGTDHDSLTKGVSGPIFCILCTSLYFYNVFLDGSFVAMIKNFLTLLPDNMQGQGQGQ